jgi:hypothetical protein
MMFFTVVLCQVGQLEGVQLVLDCSQMDAKNPFITQWAVLAIRVGTDFCDDSRLISEVSHYYRTFLDATNILP